LRRTQDVVLSLRLRSGGVEDRCASVERQLDSDVVLGDFVLRASVLLVSEHAEAVGSCLGRDRDGDRLVGIVVEVDTEHGPVIVLEERVIAGPIL